MVNNAKSMDSMEAIDAATNTWETAYDMLKQLAESVKRASSDLKRSVAQRKRNQANEKKASERAAAKEQQTAKAKAKGAAAKAAAAAASAVAAGGSAAGDTAPPVFQKNDAQAIKVFTDAEELKGSDTDCAAPWIVRKGPTVQEGDALGSCFARWCLRYPKHARSNKGRAHAPTPQDMQPLCMSLA